MSILEEIFKFFRDLFGLILPDFIKKIYNWLRLNEQWVSTLTTYLLFFLTLVAVVRVLQRKRDKGLVAKAAKVLGKSGQPIVVTRILEDEEQLIEEVQTKIKTTNKLIFKLKKGAKFMKTKIQDFFKMIWRNKITLSGWLTAILFYVHTAYLNDTAYDIFIIMKAPGWVEPVILAALTAWIAVSIGKEGYETASKWVDRIKSKLEKKEATVAEKTALAEKEKQEKLLLSTLKDIEELVIPSHQKKVEEWKVDQQVKGDLAYPKNSILPSNKFHLNYLKTIPGFRVEYLQELAKKHGLDYELFISDLTFAK